MHSSSNERSVQVVDLRVDYETEPINVPPQTPHFSWRGESSARGAAQTAYRVIVGRSRSAVRNRTADVWDSGKVSDADSTCVAYDGLPLESNTEYYWSVRIWDERGKPSSWSEPARFCTSLGGNSEWAGEWIGYQPDGGDSNGYRSRWRAESGEEEWVQVDLETVTDVNRIVLHPANPFDGPKTPDGATVTPFYSSDPSNHGTGAKLIDGAGGFGFPVRYRLDVATDPDFEDASTVVDRTDDDQPNPGTEPVAFDLGEVSARYIRLTATSLYTFDPDDPPVRSQSKIKSEYVPEARSAWSVLALAALAVDGDDGRSVAVGRPVTASSSVEAETWGRRRLVDGRLQPWIASNSPLLRTEFTGKAIRRARAHVCTLGYGELYVNGERIGDEVLNPGWTQYDERALYSTYDVTDALVEGRNAIGIWLGRGWFARNADNWAGFGSPRARLHLVVEHEDGTTRTVSTDSSWKATSSPITKNDIWDGETYDARAEERGWASPNFDDDWGTAAVVSGPGGELVPQRSQPIRVTETIEPEAITEGMDGPIVDFGENLVGWVALDVDGADRGTEIEIRHAEVLDPDGSLNRTDLRTAEAIDRYVCSGTGAESYEPRFTYHGFRYVQLVDYPEELSPDAIRAKRVHTDVDSSGTFACSNDELGRVQANAERGLRGNLHSVLTDCPQRDERFGWTGDNHIAARALLYNFDGGRFYRKWMDDHEDARSAHGYISDTIPYGYGTIPEDPTWGITQVTVPWHLYRHYGDVDVLERHYNGMRQYVEYWYAQSDDGIIPAEYGNYGDWLAFENADGRHGLPYDLFNSAFHYHTTALLAKIAAVLGNGADAERYRTRADEITAAFTEEFFDPETATFGPGTQSSYAVPLFVGLVPEAHVERVAEGLAETVRADDGQLKTGFLGTRPLLHVLVEHGYEELAYEIVTQPERPGWVYMVRQGATTMWERWDSDDRVGDGMNSFNHSPFTFVSEWFYEALAGLTFDESMHGSATVEVSPAIVDDLTWAAGSLETVNGSFASHWERTDSGEVILEVTIPWNTEATVRIPGNPSAITIEESDEPVWEEGVAMERNGVDGIDPGENAVSLTVGSGGYTFEVLPERDGDQSDTS